MLEMMSTDEILAQAYIQYHDNALVMELVKRLEQALERDEADRQFNHFRLRMEVLKSRYGGGLPRRVLRAEDVQRRGHPVAPADDGHREEQPAVRRRTAAHHQRHHRWHAHRLRVCAEWSGGRQR